MALLRPGAPVRAWLGWAAFLYGLVVRVRMWAYDRGWCGQTRLPCRVISVGNLTVGGTGKTPMVILLTEWLQAKGQRVAILSRGYKRASTSPRMLVSDGRRLLAGPGEAGDEPYLIARRCPKAVVAVGADRAALGRWLLDHEPVDCVILDDGFQHRALYRDCDLVLIDAMDATGLDGLLPAGRLREPLTGLRRAAAAVITRADSERDVSAVRSRLQRVLPAEALAVEVRFKSDEMVSVMTEEHRPVHWAVGKKAWLVSGIGNSEAFRRLAMDLGIQVLGETAYIDHHAYGPEDLSRIRAHVQRVGAEMVLTTEKDAGKLAPLLSSDDPWWALRLRADVVRGEEWLRRLIQCEGQEARGRGRLDE
ncbi:MAG TPA: tetraacyldisaccharide 4'-kinase [Nitrospira sp.]|nr:tetraacyldisaccharide 4'-kinase [Nitrospira sp.]